MTKQEFLSGIPFVYEGEQYRFMVGFNNEVSPGYLARVDNSYQSGWAYVASIDEFVDNRGVRVFSHWLGKKVSVFLHFNRLDAKRAKVFE